MPQKILGGRRPQGARGQSPPPSRKRWLVALQAASHFSIYSASVLQHTASQTRPNPSETSEFSHFRVDIEDGSLTHCPRKRHHLTTPSLPDGDPCPWC